MRRNCGSFKSVACLAALSLAGCAGIVDTRSEYETFSDSRALDEFERLDVDLDFGVGNLDLAVVEDTGQLYRLELEYDRLHYEPDLAFNSSGSTATLRFELDSTGGIPIGDNDNDLVLRLTPRIPLNVALDAGVGQSYLDFTGLRVERMSLDGGVGRSEIAFDSVQEPGLSVIDIDSGVGEVIVRGLGNARVNEFRFDGGVGSAEIDFTGDWGDARTRADIDVGVGEIHLLIPEELRVEILSDDSFLSDFSARDFERRGSRYFRNVVDGEPAQAVIRIDAGLGEVRVDVR